VYLHTLTLTQPYATLIAVGAKQLETRSWPTKHRGLLAIHAAGSLAGISGPGISGPDALRALCRRPAIAAALRAVRLGPDRLPLGAVVALCRVAACVRTEETHGLTPTERAFGDYTPGRWAWVLGDVWALPVPIPARGYQGLWTWDCPDRLVAASGLAGEGAA
jgi:hypothetical protein